MRSIAQAVIALLLLQPASAPDIVIFNARVFTGVGGQPWAEAIAIAGDRIAMVGSTDAVKKLSGASTRQIDAAGRLVIPGINDAHLHIAARPPATTLEGPPEIAADPTLDMVLVRLKSAVAKAPPGGWIVGEIGATVLDDPRATRILLDTIAANNPVALSAWTGHGTLLNSRALEELGIRDDEPDPPGGFFVRLGTANAITGLAHEYAGYGISRLRSLKAQHDAHVAALRSMSERALSLGITSVQIMWISLAIAQAAQTAIAAAIPLRVRLIDFPLSGMRSWHSPASRTTAGGPMVLVSGTKFIVDGTPVERLMLLRAPYADRSTTRGQSNFSAGDLTAFLKAALAAGEQPMLHAVGDGAIDMVLDALERTGAEKWQPLRPRLEHGDMLEPGHFARTKRFGVVLVQNPSHLMLPELVQQRLGDRVARTSLLKSTLAADIPVALGSDGPINPYLNLMFATINTNNPPEAMTREQAVRAYTSGSAFAEMEESRKGTIATGMLADVAMLSQDIFTVPPDALPSTVSLMTIIGGKVVYERRPLPNDD
jgi:predicted amidohydrolase YtcJ